MGKRGINTDEVAKEAVSTLCRLRAESLSQLESSPTRETSVSISTADSCNAEEVNYPRVIRWFHDDSIEIEDVPRERNNQGELVVENLTVLVPVDPEQLHEARFELSWMNLSREISGFTTLPVRDYGLYGSMVLDSFAER